MTRKFPTWTLPGEDSPDYVHDPLRPSHTDPTPVELVAALTRPQREQRVQTLIEYARQIIELALAEHGQTHEIVGHVGMFSGGNDSTTMMHLLRPLLTHAGMANTGIGIEETRQYVRDTCAEWGLPLIERTPPDSYEDLVFGRVVARTGPNKGNQVWPAGFPGPSAHGFYFQRLKERCFDAIRRALVRNPKRQRVVFYAGRRRQESDRRKDVPFWERRGSTIWISPLALWTKLDLNTYRLMFGDVPRNWVSDVLHMSGECLCGAFAHPGELDEIGEFFPKVKAYLVDLGKRLLAAGIDPTYAIWGHGKGGKPKRNKLCGNCRVRYDLGTQETLFDLGEDAA